MPKKNIAETDAETSEIEPTVAESVALEPLLLAIRAEHVITPHGVELRRTNGKVTDVRTQDFASTQAIGARTIESIVRECGAELPSGEREITISFSPHTGDVIAIA